MITGPVLCPSAPCVPGASLIGVRQADGTTAYLPRPLPVSSEFAALARDAGAPGTRYRFSMPCREGGCGQWKDGRCGVADAVEKLLRPSDGALPACAIRRHCRWFRQNGAEACRVCTFVAFQVPGEPAQSAVAE